jgi:hypothetical protein
MSAIGDMGGQKAGLKARTAQPVLLSLAYVDIHHGRIGR